MKKLLSLVLLFLIGCSEPEPEPLNYQLLVERDGVHYRRDNSEIYSGPVFNIDGKSEGYFKKGKWNGPLKFYYDNGQLKQDVTFKDGKPDGTYIFYYTDGQMKEYTIFKDGVQIGWKNFLYFSNGQLNYEYNMINHKTLGYIKEGPSKSWYENGQLYEEETYKNDKLNGPYKKYWENGQLYEEGTLKDGKWNGPYKKYWENGQLSDEGTWKDGKQNGPWKFYYKNGQLKEEVTLIEHSLDGPYKLYNEDGKLVEEGIYEDGELIDSKRY